MSPLMSLKLTQRQQQSFRERGTWQKDLEFALDTKAEYESPKEMRVDGPAGGQWRRPSAVSGISMAFSGMVK